ncbi:MAG: hypothetical protein ACI8TQ_000108 [Planctomycetota bacterium]
MYLWWFRHSYHCRRLVVDVNGGAAFTAIQPAIDAANEGDIVLVKNGIYAGFEIDSKSISVVAHLDETVGIRTPVNVQNLLTNQRVSLINLEATVEATLDGSGLLAVNDIGTIRALGCTFTGARDSQYFFSLVPDGAAGVKLIDTTKIAFAGCVISGGEGTYTSVLYYQGGNAATVPTVFVVP